MKEKKLRQLKRRIQVIKEDLQGVGEMRPGSLSKHFSKRKGKNGPFFHLSYTHKMQGRTEYIRQQFVAEIRLQIRNYKKFKKLTEKWVELSIEHSKLQIEIAKETEKMKS